MKKWIVLVLIFLILVLGMTLTFQRAASSIHEKRWQVSEKERIELEEVCWEQYHTVTDLKKALQKLKKMKTLPVISPKLPEVIEIIYPFEDIVQETISSVVHIANEDGGWQGSGVLIAPDLILTARHVVEDSDSFIITFNDSNSVSADRAISSKKYDLGFIKLDDPVDIKPVELASIKECKLGQQVYTISSQFGIDHFNSVTLGIISAMQRDRGESWGWQIIFQIDAGANPGSSGGPIFNIAGEVIGVVVGAPTQVFAGIVYIVPSNLIIEDIDEIELMFVFDRYEFEEEVIYDSYGDYYSLPGTGLGK